MKSRAPNGERVSSRPMARGDGARPIVYLTVLAAPVALAFETLLRHLLFPSEFEEVRAFFEPTLTPIAWVLCILAALASLAGVVLQRRLVRSRLERMPEADAAARRGQIVGVFLLTASVPQIPSVFSTLAFTLGASLAPVLVGIGIASAGVIVQAIRMRALFEAA